VIHINKNEANFCKIKLGLSLDKNTEIYEMCGFHGENLNGSFLDYDSIDFHPEDGVTGSSKTLVSTYSNEQHHETEDHNPNVQTV
jgi:hypothetical protein